MCLDNIVKIAQIFAYAVGGISLLITVFNYRQNNKVKKGEWLKSLFEKFYEGEKFSIVRKEIEYERIHTYLAINEKGEATNEQNEEELVNYLNFFEFISTLIRNKYLTTDEVDQIFRYYLRSIKNNTYLQEYLGKYDFENLAELLKSYE